MTHDRSMKNDLLVKLKAARLAKGFSPEKLSEAAGLSRSYMRKFEAGAMRSPSADNLASLAKVLGMTVDELQLGPGEAGTSAPVPPKANGPATPAGHEMLHVRWRARAGAWLEIEEDQSDPQIIPVPISPRYEQASRFLVDIQGDSMNKTPLRDGAKAICVDVDDLGYEPPSGSIVLVQRSEDGGHTIETTVKRLYIFKDRYELRPESTNERHETITMPRTIEHKDGVIIKILGLVVGAYFDEASLR